MIKTAFSAVVLVLLAAATTNVAYTITVVGTKTGRTETYSNPAHVLSAANTDQSSFNNCP